MSEERRGATPPDPTAEMEAERLVGWLRLPAVVLIGFGETVSGTDDRDGFLIVLLAFAVWAVGAMIWVHRHRVDPRFGLWSSTVDMAAITALSFLSGGGFSEARIAYVLIPVTLAFRFKPEMTAVGGAAAVLAYLTQALSHPSGRTQDGLRTIAIQAGYLAWVSAAAVLLAFLLARRTRRASALATGTNRLLADALNAEERERQALSESLHDSALQNLLAVRHELQEAADGEPSAGIARAEAIVAETAKDLREMVADLHPLVLEHGGLKAALSAIAARAGRIGGFRVHLVCDTHDHHRHERLVVTVARELLNNVAKHAGAHEVEIRCVQESEAIRLTVIDDGVGFDPAVLEERASAGHIGLSSQRARVELAGGTLTLISGPAGGVVATVRLPGGPSAPSL